MLLLLILSKANLGIAQQVERVIWDHEAAGSRPATQTIKKAHTATLDDFLADNRKYISALPLLETLTATSNFYT